MAKKDSLQNLDVETRLGLCRHQEHFHTIKGGDLSYFVYDLAGGYLDKNDLEHPVVNDLIDSYGNQLLRPLFQDSPLYSRVNTTAEGKPKYDSAATVAEVASYSGILGEFIDPCFLLLDSTAEPRFKKLIGYTLGFGLQQPDGVQNLIETKLWATADDIELRFPLSYIDLIAGKTAYASGVGVAPDFQEKGGLGLMLMHKFLAYYQDLGYESIVLRVKKGATNWPLFTGKNGDPATIIPGTINLAWYSNEVEGEKYRGIFLNNIQLAMNHVEELLAGKGSPIPTKV